MTLDLCKSGGIKISSIRYKEKRRHFSFPVFSREASQITSLKSMFSLVVLRRNIFKAVFILISQHRKPRCVCVWSCIQLLSDYFYPPIFQATTMKLTIRATSVIQAMTTDTRKDAQKGFPEGERECSFLLACIFLNIRVAFACQIFSYIGGEWTLQKSFRIKPYPYTLSTHKYRR